MSNNKVFLASKEDAEEVLKILKEILAQFNFATQADFYELVGLPSTHANAKLGWASLDNAQIRETKHGYLIDLPAMEAI